MKLEEENRKRMLEATARHHDRMAELLEAEGRTTDADKAREAARLARREATR
ncbi:MAG TPA: hypothetical protein VIV15_03635 [Anaerolineales bacterium]